MKKAIPALLAAAVVSTLAAQAHASISLVATVIPWDLTDPDFAGVMQTNGWEAVKLSLVGDGTQSTQVVAWDFKNAVSGFTDAAHNPTGLTIGITGPLFQDWAENTLNSTNGTPSPQMTSAQVFPTSPTDTEDSFFNLFDPSFNFTDVNSAAEDNNLANVATNLPNNYTGSPLADDPATGTVKKTSPGDNFGVGSIMTWAGAIKPDVNSNDPGFSTSIHAAPLSVDLAYIVIPVNGTGNNAVRIYGVAGDQSGGDFTINALLNAPAINGPEPTSVGLLGLGAAGLLARRKRSSK